MQGEYLLRSISGVMAAEIVECVVRSDVIIDFISNL